MANRDKVLVPVTLLEYCHQELTWVRGQYGSENDRRCLQIERILKKYGSTPAPEVRRSRNARKPK